MLTKGIDITFVMTIYNQGWILEKIADHISAAAESVGCITSKFFLYGGNKVHHTFPKSNFTFYMHYSNFYHLAKKLDSRTAVSPVIWFTHYDPKKEITIKQLVDRCIEYDAIVLCPCSSNEKLLIENGMPKDKVSTILGGFDAKLLSYHDRKPEKAISFVSACYERKRPDLLMSLVEEMPDYHFNIIGPHPDDIDNKELLWSRSKYKEQIKKLPNVSLYEVDYTEYPKLMMQSSLYLMLSDFEGGPIGLIEAMALDLIPICTDTGFVKDLMIGRTKKGIVPVDPSVEMLKETIANVDLHSNPRDKVKDFDWVNFSKAAVNFMFESNGFLNEVKNPFYYAISKEMEYKDKKEYKKVVEMLSTLSCNPELSSIQRNIIKLKINHYKSLQNELS